MDIRFLKDMCRAYVVDRSLGLVEDELFNEFRSLLQEVRQKDIDLYNELYSLDRIYQKNIIYNYFDLESSDDASLNEIEIFSLPIFITSLITYLVGRQLISHGVHYKILYEIGKRLESLANKFSKMGRYWRLRYAIIAESFRSCYTKCGVDPHSFDMKLLRNVRYADRKPTTPEDLKKTRCMVDCTLATLINLIALTTESYFVCLKKTGEFNQIRDVSSNDLLSLISSTQIGVSCLSYYEDVQQSLKDFYQILDYVCAEKPEMKHQWLNRLRETLYQTKNKAVKIDSSKLDNNNKE